LILELVEEGDGGVKEECEDEELAPKTEAARGYSSSRAKNTN